MGELTLISDFSLDVTSVSNIYIDEYMSANNESQIKIYLFLLRNLSKGTPVSVIMIADTFNYSVTDVERALIFMEKQGLMSLKMDKGSITGLKLLPLKKKRSDALPAESFILMQTSDSVKEETMSADKSKEEEFVAPEKPEYSKDEIKTFKAQAEIDELLFVIQAYTGKPLTIADIKSVKYIYDELEFGTELIDFLVEHNVGRGKKSFAYIEKVAIDWYRLGVKNVKDAKAVAFDVPEDVYKVFKAFSIKGGSRKPSASEIAFVNKWTGKYAFTMDVIELACQTTIDKTHTVSFEYADAVLTDWNKKGVKHLSQAKELLNNRKPQGGKSGNTAAGENTRNKQGVNSFNNFSGREYDFAMLEKELLQN